MLVTAVAVLAQPLVRRRNLLLPAAGVVALLVVAVLTIPATRGRLLNGQTLDGRFLQWKLTLDIVRDHPLLGIGPSRYVDVFGQYESTEWIRWAGTRTFPDSPHNWPLQVLVAGGIPLLLAALALGAVVLHRGWRAAQAQPELLGLFAAVVGYGVAMLVNFTIAGSTCLAAFLAGALIAGRIEPTEQREPVWQRHTALGLAGLATVGLFLACVSEVYLQRGMDSVDEARLTPAKEGFATARALRPLDADVAMLQAQALAAMTNTGLPQAARPAEATARDSLDGTPDTYASQVALGVALLAQNRLPEAVEVLDRAVALYPERPAARIQRGIGRFGMRDVEGARADLHKAQALAPKSRTAQRILDIIDQRVGAG
jgi:hypothetical protein